MIKLSALAENIQLTCNHHLAAALLHQMCNAILAVLHDPCPTQRNNKHMCLLAVFACGFAFAVAACRQQLALIALLVLPSCCCSAVRACNSLTVSTPGSRAYTTNRKSLTLGSNEVNIQLQGLHATVGPPG